MAQQRVPFVPEDSLTFLRFINRKSDTVTHRQLFDFIFEKPSNPQQSSVEPQTTPWTYSDSKVSQPQLQTSSYTFQRTSAPEQAPRQDDSKPQSARQPQSESNYHYSRTQTRTEQTTKTQQPRAEAPKRTQEQNEDRENDPNRSNVSQSSQLNYRLEMNKKPVQRQEPQSSEVQESPAPRPMDSTETLLRERERELERSILRSRSLERFLYYPPPIGYYAYSPYYYPYYNPIYPVELDIIRSQRIADLETESRLLDLERKRREEIDQQLREQEERERTNRQEFLNASRSARKNIDDENDRIRKLREASQILDEELRLLTQSKRQRTSDLKNSTPQQRDRYFDPNGQYPYGIIEAINEYNPTGETPNNNKYPKYSSSEYTPEKTTNVSTCIETYQDQPQRQYIKVTDSTYTKSTRVEDGNRRQPALP